MDTLYKPCHFTGGTNDFPGESASLGCRVRGGNDTLEEVESDILRRFENRGAVVFMLRFKILVYVLLEIVFTIASLLSKHSVEYVATAIFRQTRLRFA